MHENIAPGLYWPSAKMLTARISGERINALNRITVIARSIAATDEYKVTRIRAILAESEMKITLLETAFDKLTRTN